LNTIPLDEMTVESEREMDERRTFYIRSCLNLNGEKKYFYYLNEKQLSLEEAQIFFTKPQHQVLENAPTPFQKVTVHYGTNRGCTILQGNYRIFDNQVTDQLTTGTVLVHVEGLGIDEHLPSSGYTTHLVSEFLNVVGEEEFKASLGEDDVLLFVHGYCVPYADALMLAAKFYVATNFNGKSATFLWPSHGKTSMYSADRANVTDDKTVAIFARYLNLLRENNLDKRIHIIVHSIGNELVTKLMQTSALLRLPLANAIQSVVFAAPDVSQGDFVSRIQTWDENRPNEHECQLTAYTCQRDEALRASYYANGFKVRFGAKPIPVDGLKVVQVQGLKGLFNLRHSYVHNTQLVCQDLHVLFCAICKRYLDDHPEHTLQLRQPPVQNDMEPQILVANPERENYILGVLTSVHSEARSSS